MTSSRWEEEKETCPEAFQGGRQDKHASRTQPAMRSFVDLIPLVVGSNLLHVTALRAWNNYWISWANEFLIIDRTDQFFIVSYFKCHNVVEEYRLPYFIKF